MYPRCHPSQLNCKDLQPRPPVHHQDSSQTTRVYSLIGFTCFLFLHSAQGPEPPVAKGRVESRLHPAGVCRQHGHRAPFRPHGQRAFCHRTGNSPSAQAPIDSFRHLCNNCRCVRCRALQRQRTCTLRESVRVDHREHR